MLGFVYCYLVCKMYEDKKIENLNNEYIAQIIDAMQYQVFHYVIQVILKLFCLKPGAYSFAQFLYCN